jgi:hypothetical protein
MIIAALIGCGFIWPGWIVEFIVVAIGVGVIGTIITLCQYVENESSMDWL